MALETLKFLTTEILITIGAALVLIADLVFLRKRPLSERFQKVGLLSALILIGVMTFLFFWNYPNTRALDRMLVFDGLTVFFKFAILLITLITVLISTGYPATSHVGEYFAMLFFSCLGMLFLVGTEDLLMIYVSLELLSISLYILTAFHRGVLRSAEGALKYFLFGALSSAFLFFGASYLYGLSGATRLDTLGEFLNSAFMTQTPQPLLYVSMIFLIVGLGFKIAVVPFHLWAPDAYEGAPTPVTAFISTGSKLASFVVLIKIALLTLWPIQGSALHYEVIGGWVPLLAVIACASMTLGNLVAMTQTNLKRLLAYSSIAHAGYILIGIVAATRMGIASVFYYLFIYAFTNLGAFGVIAALSAGTGGDDIEDFSGLSQRTPFLSLLMALFVLSLAGIPPLAGFFGKFYVFLAAIEKDPVHYGLAWLVVVGIINSAISLYYYLRILKQMYFIKPKEMTPIKVPAPVMVALVGCAIAVLAFGIFPNPLIRLFEGLLIFLPAL